MASLTSMAKAKFKSPKRRKSSKNMAKRKSRSKSRSSGSSGNSPFSGKILGFKIPFVADVLKNKTLQKAIAGAGIVSIALSAAQLINNAQVNRALNNKAVRLGLAGAAGDVTGLATEFLKEGGIDQIKGLAGGTPAQNAQTTLVSSAGNGIA